MQQTQTIGLIGTTFRRGGATQLSYFSLASPYEDSEGKGSPVAHLAREAGLSECVYLATCNRVEILFAAPSTLPLTTIRRRIYDFFARRHEEQSSTSHATTTPMGGLHAYGEDGAIERLFVVASALDSMVPGEAQVLGQLKAAVAEADACGMVGSQLRPLINAAMTAAKEVREQTHLGRGRTSMASLAEDAIQTHMAQRVAPTTTLAIIGVGKMSEVCATRFSQRDDVSLLIVNRRVEHAYPLAQKCGARVMALSQFLQAPPAVDVVVSATASPQPVFAAPFFERFQAAHKVPPMMIDLAIPPDIDPASALAAEVKLIDFSQLSHIASGHRRKRQALVAEARQLVDARVLAFEQRRRERQITRTIRLWRGHCKDVLAARLKELPKDVSRQAVEVWAHQLVSNLAHAPTQGLKALGHRCGQTGVDAFARGAGLGDRELSPKNIHAEDS